MPLDALGLRVQTALTPWPEPRRTPVAGVSSFGLGGTNCHVVVEGPGSDGPAPAEPSTATGTVLWPLSAAGPEALRDQAARLRDHLARHPDAVPADIGHPRHHPHRLPPPRRGAGRGPRPAHRRRHRPRGRPPRPRHHRRRRPHGPARPGVRVPGAGAQWSRMGLELADAFPVFAASLDACGEALGPFTDWDLRTELAGISPASMWCSRRRGR
ncbi:ketoacyl-synthetase C-terminal extension domain-containing protein [Streptomyces zhihengii]